MYNWEYGVYLVSVSITFHGDLRARLGICETLSSFSEIKGKAAKCRLDKNMDIIEGFESLSPALSTLLQGKFFPTVRKPEYRNPQKILQLVFPILSPASDCRTFGRNDPSYYNGLPLPDTRTATAHVPVSEGGCRHSESVS